MNKGRKSIFVILGRLFQSIPPLFFIWIEVILKKCYIKKYPLIIIISPPRSGSTLTYQILSRGSKSLYLTNLWNLLYSTPIIGGLLSKRDQTKRHNFTSDRGLVSGIFGESEGLRVLEDWPGQGLEEGLSIPVRRIKYLRKIFGRLLSKEYPMITSFLGHSFSMNNLRKMFPGCVFIYLKRDKLSNIYSMYNIGKGFEWFSLKPRGWEESLKLPVHERFVWQYNQIVSSIEDQILDKDTYIVNYEDICDDPRKFLTGIKSFVAEKGIDLSLELENIPQSFNVSKIDPDLDNDSRIIYKILQNG